MQLDEFGCYRSLEPAGVLPQNSWKLDNTPEPRPGEKLVSVEVLNVDASSFHQMRSQAQQESRRVEEIVWETVRTRGKLHNPVTGSGGMLLGSLPDGQRIATLVSLTLTPLQLEAIHRVDDRRDRIFVSGQAILFPRTLYCPLPADISEGAALAVLDVAGAPAHAAKLSKQARNVLLVGAGKAGLLTASAVRRENPPARLLAVDARKENLDRMARLGLCDWSRVMDARQPLEAFRAVSETTSGQLADLTFNLVDQPETEGASILATRDGGTVCFFSMATSFARAALTAEGVARDLTLLIGSGYRPGWTDYALGLLRDDPRLRECFEADYGD